MTTFDGDLARLVETAARESASDYEDDVLEPSGRRIQASLLAGREAVRQALALLDEEEPPPTTDELLESASGSWWGAGMPRRFAEDVDEYELALRGLDEQLQRALLLPHCNRLRSRLDSAARSTLEALLLWYLESLDLENYRGTYLSAYRSPREHELEGIVGDRKRPEPERRDAADQLAKIEAKRRRDRAKKEEAANTEAALWWAASNQSSGLLLPPCKKHGQRHCSECGKRKGRKGLERRFAVLARDLGYEPEALRAPVGRGRPSEAEKPRLDALDSVVRTLVSEGYSQADVGRHLKRDRRLISRLVRRAA